VAAILLSFVLPSLEGTVHVSQNGFVRGRQFLQNRVDLDLEVGWMLYDVWVTEMFVTLVACSLTIVLTLLPLLPFLIFAKAFARAAPQWHLRVLASIGMPEHLIIVI